MSGGGHPCEYDEGGPLTQVKSFFTISLLNKKQFLCYCTFERNEAIDTVYSQTVLKQVTASGQPIVIGIMSKNEGCDNLNIPTIYTRYFKNCLLHVLSKCH